MRTQLPRLPWTVRATGFLGSASIVCTVFLIVALPFADSHIVATFAAMTFAASAPATIAYVAAALLPHLWLPTHPSLPRDFATFFTRHFRRSSVAAALFTFAAAFLSALSLASLLDSTSL